MKSKTKNINTPLIIGGSILLLVALFFIAANLIVFRDNCGSPCEFDPNNPSASCPSVCVKTEQTLWEKLTGQKPRTVGY